jgi:hypothetical protein
MISPDTRTEAFRALSGELASSTIVNNHRGVPAMQSSSKEFIDDLINTPTTGSAKLAAGEILRLREGVQDVIDGLRAGREAELCARRLEMLLGLRKRLNDTPRRRSARTMQQHQAIKAKAAARSKKKSTN